ncbi:hypothetical protein RND71_017412 [Anisodus tanguticus]|uniref:Uncharacterized protein n=1 Tax=Anisodus tanguticus TaxID=243964 RepID=A0AAE1VFZ7_9SOLA|nr:hypothetical protein RND71_017412 [Anisodus tanguticus]
MATLAQTMAALAQQEQEQERNERLVAAGYELLQLPPSSKEELLEKLDDIIRLHDGWKGHKTVEGERERDIAFPMYLTWFNHFFLVCNFQNLEHLLSRVEQVPPASAQGAIQPAMEALVADGLLRHPDIDVKVSVASCISEIMRITAPEQPYDDNRTKASTTHYSLLCCSPKFEVRLDFFELALLAFGKLSCLDGRCYSKAVSIIEVLAKYRTCVLMWDLELDALVIQMFQHFLNSIRPDHPDRVFMDIEEIMSTIINESEGIPMQLLNILISSVKKENQNVSPRSYVLGERVLQESAVKLQPYLPTAVRSLSISTNNYSEVLELILRENAIKFLPKSGQERNDQFVNGASEPQVENGPEELCHKVACFDDVRPPTAETSTLPDTDSKVAASNGTIVISVRPVDDSFKMQVNNDSVKLSHNANYDGKVGPSLPGSSKSPTNADPSELAPHAAPEKVASFLDQSSDLLGKDDPERKVDDIVLETDTTLKESEHRDAMKQQRSTDSRTTLPPENLGFINAAKKELDPEATQASKKRGWKPNFLNKPEEGYDHAWLSGERRSKSRILLKGCGKNTKKRSSCSPKCAISNGLYSSSGEEKTPIMTSIKRCQKEKNDKKGQNDGAQFSSISARDSAGAITKKKVSQPTLVASEEFAVLEALEKKHQNDDKKNVSARYHDKRRRSSVEESGAETLGSVFSITKESNFAKTSKEQRKRKNSPSQEEALGSVSNTKGSNFPKTSEEQCKRKSSPSQEEALGSVSITKKINFPKTSKKQSKRKNSLSQEEALGSVSITKQSNFPNTSKEQRKRKNPPSQEEDSADKVVREHGEELVGCRVRVWWPLDQVFYGGHVTLFDHSEKKHMVIYEDGDQEMLNLARERWELVEDDNASVPVGSCQAYLFPSLLHKIVPGPSDSSDMRLGCIVDSYRQIRKKKKALNVDDDVPVLTPGTESKKIVCSKAKLCWGKATVDPTPPSTMTMQQNLTPKGVHQNKGTKVEVSESGVDGNPVSWTTPIKVSPEDGDECSELVDVHGYKVKVSNAPILAAIFAKYGDITVNCHYKSPTVRASLLDVVSDVVRRLKTSDVNSSSIKSMKSVVSDAADAKLDVTWLQQYLDEIFKEEDMEEKSSYLMALSDTTMLVSEAVKKDLVERNREVLAAEKRLKKAERRLQEAQNRAGEAKRSVKVFDILGKKVQQDIKEVKDQAQYWLSRLNELL